MFLCVCVWSFLHISWRKIMKRKLLVAWFSFDVHTVFTTPFLVHILPCAGQMRAAGVARRRVRLLSFSPSPWHLSFQDLAWLFWTVTCPQREVVQLPGLICQRPIISFWRPKYTWCNRKISENKGLFIYPSTEVLSALVIRNRLYLFVKSLSHPPKYGFLVVILDVKK